MANSTHKGSEFNNIIETWNQNERNLGDSNNAPHVNPTDNDVPQENSLEQVIRQEAAEYDSEAKENQLLGGDRATVNDDIDADDSGE